MLSQDEKDRTVEPREAQSDTPIKDGFGVACVGYDSEKQTRRVVDPRERLSAYFTIAAAAAGLISDGCQCFLRRCKPIN